MERLAIRQKLLEALGGEVDKSVRHKIEDAIAEVARQYSDNDDTWPELLGVLFEASQSKNEFHREGAFRIISTTPGIIEKQHEDTVLSAFTKGFKDDDVTVSYNI